MSAATGGRQRLRRLFFAIIPDDDVRRAIVDATRGAVAECGGRAVPATNLHVTVIFLGEIDREREERAASSLPVSAAPFELELAKLFYWRRGQILWLEPVAVPAALVELEATLGARLADRGFARESKPYRPHMTLARRARPIADAAIEPIRWPVRALSLVESVTAKSGVTYTPRSSWPL